MGAQYSCLRDKFESSSGNRKTHYRLAMAKIFEQIMQLEMEKIINASDLGEIMSLERTNWHQLVELKHGKEGPKPSKEYKGSPFIKVVPARNIVEQGEDLLLNVIAMGVPRPKYIIDYLVVTRGKVVVC